MIVFADAEASGVQKLVENDICSIIVTYNPTAQLLDNIAALRHQVSGLVIIDNGSRPEGIDIVQKSSSMFNCDVILNDSNLGIAKALNLGVNYAESRGFKKVLLFDQDSVVEDRDYVTFMLDAYERSNPCHRTAIVAPRYIDRSSGAEMPSFSVGDGYLVTSISSGTLIPIDIFEILGLHDESLYMDYVDIEFCLRCRGAGYSIIEEPKAILRHSLGRRTKHDILGKAFSSTNHDAGRRYYITRNRLLLMRKYWRDWRWSFREMRAFTFELIKIILVEDSKRHKLHNIWRGVIDAYNNRTGYRIGL